MSALAYDFDQHGHLVSPAPRVVPMLRPASTAPMAARRSPLPAPLARPPRPADLRLDRGRDALLDTPETWQSIVEHEGSVQHLDGLDDDEKLVFRTAFEIDQRWIIELAADRAPFICQSQSINLYLPADIDKWDLHMLHWTAWKRGIKSLYYCRSKSVSRAAFAGQLQKAAALTADEPRTDYEECLACQ